MYSFAYLWSKFMKKIRGKAVRDSKIHPSAKIGAGSNIVNIEMGKHSYCGYDCTIVECKIGAFCSMADNVSIGLASHPIDWVSTSPAFIGEREQKEGKDSIQEKYAEHFYEAMSETVIGNDVWIGKGAFIKAGVRVGNGAVIGMGSVVTKDVPDYAIVGGIPAKIIRMRFEENIIKEFQKIAWWDWEDEKIKKHAPYFNNIKKFFDNIEKEE